MNISGPESGIRADCERVLRTLPGWFGIEASLVGYAVNADRLPTFVAHEGDTIIGFLSLEQHFPASWELHCIAVDAAYRATGVGGRLHRHAEDWLDKQGDRILQVKTLAASHPIPAYAQTRKFYERMDYLPVEGFPTLWDKHLPVLQLVKALTQLGLS